MLKNEAAVERSEIGQWVLRDADMKAIQKADKNAYIGSHSPRIAYQLSRYRTLSVRTGGVVVGSLGALTLSAFSSKDGNDQRLQ